MTTQETEGGDGDKNNGEQEESQVIDVPSDDDDTPQRNADTGLLDEQLGGLFGNKGGVKGPTLLKTGRKISHTRLDLREARERESAERQKDAKTKLLQKKRAGK